MKARMLLLGLLAAVAGCSKPEGTLAVSGTHPLLQKPYPLDYPSTAPKPNKVVRNLKDERVTLVGLTIEKDFLVYEVRTNDGVEGYVVAGDGVVVVASE